MNDQIQNLEQQIKALIGKRREIIESQALDKEYIFTHDFGLVEKLPITKDTVVVYQGVPGAYSHQAMRKFFGDEINNRNVDAFSDVIQEVMEGRADYGVLPIENSTAGFVSGIWDLVGESGITIVGEEEVVVRHMLLGLPKAELSDIKTVYSHNQGLMQCKNYLDTTNWKRHSVANTAMAAVKVRDDADISKAAIASELSADIYDLKVLDRNIVNEGDNTTRFIIITKNRIYTKNAKNISLSFALKHESGSLYNILTHINLNGINMTSIESRPRPGKKFEYSFFVNIEGSLTDKCTLEALYGIYKDSRHFKLIGTF